ncbi:peptidoglycan DD-metalloendopeptidase family protein [Pusillimonas sp. CC-YST705]|uniref:Peptidoglycan DD-metalloendopeptidase family protein n=1 Tax=Mesopusillimonas faecipullorum TaxID=2755040 RepID=A0ABS8CAZ4_9BURK|nr:peptidoglycan DD-metalloendopeptidase family protein [Mesopusillimonas faecipullorum]MCB5363185.1 peptidoglycan DD-metalloendopeptidase family protein [Mesopusillimonas faecipullorum]
MHAQALQLLDKTTHPIKQAVAWRALGAVLVAVALAGCASKKTSAPITDLNQGGQSGTAAAMGGTYVVKSGDTLFGIARAHNTSVAQLVRMNDLIDPNRLWAGQILRLSDDASPVASSSSVAGTSTPREPVAKPVQTVETKAPARASDAGVVSWGWPAQGKIIQGFNTNTKGVDIEGKQGDPVAAAAAGKVMYVGNGVRGLGNLVLLDHGNGFMTAYAHNQKLLVTAGQQVKKGDRIALLGMTDTTSPRLHFEIRRGGTPVNPLSYLPAR